MNIHGFDIGPLQAFGFLGTLTFGTRFLVQWLASERAKKSIVPMSFWWLSIVGSVIFLVYFSIQKDIVGVLGFVPNLVPYTRNLILIRREKHCEDPVEDDEK